MKIKIKELSLEQIFACFLLVAIVGFLFSTPRLAGADEGAHQVTAWNLQRDPLGTNSSRVPVPAFLNESACFAFKPSQDASCLESSESESYELQTAAVTNYPILYYHTVLPGMKLFANLDPSLATLGGRISSLVIQFLLLMLVVKVLRRSNLSIFTILFACLTSTWIFFLTVINPTSLELNSVFFYSALLGILFREGLATGNRSLISVFGFVTVIACAARPISALWVALIFALALSLWRKSPLKPRSWFLLALVQMPGFLIAALWFLTHPNPAISAAASSTPSPSFLSIFFENLRMFPVSVLEMMGNLGWLDTGMPGPIFFLLALTWLVVYLRILPRGLVLHLAVFFSFAVVIAPTALESLAFQKLGYFWWQGRYTLPVVIGALAFILITNRSDKRAEITFLWVANSIAVSIMLLLNTFRYNFGLNGAFPMRLSNPALGELRYLGSLLCFALMILLIAALIKVLRNPSNREISGFGELT